MREYLFRAKRVDNGEWVEGSLIYGNKRDQNDSIKTIECVYICWAFYDNIKYYAEVIPETVRQFTGLCDKNGKRIFEGDIISSDSNSKFIIKWNKNKAKFVSDFVNKSEDYFGDYYCNLSDEYIKQNFNVIGNIHTTTELLEVEE